MKLIHYIFIAVYYLSAPNAEATLYTQLKALSSLLAHPVLMLTDLYYNNNKQSTALIEAVKNNSVKTVRTLIALGADVNAPRKSKYGETPLMIAINHDHEHCFNELLSQKTINTQDHKGNTPLMNTLYRWNLGREYYIRKLLEHPDIDLTIKNNNGETILMAASADNLRTLLAHAGTNIDINAQDNGGKTALMHAIHDQESFNILLADIRTDVNKRDNQGLTPLMAAIENDHYRYLAILDERKGCSLMGHMCGNPVAKYCTEALLKHPNFEINADKTKEKLPNPAISTLTTRISGHGPRHT